MARALSPREVRLAVVLGVVLLALVWMRSDVDLDRVGGAPPPDPRRAGEQEMDAPVVRMDLLNAAAQDAQGPERDLFKYTQRPPSAEEIAAARRQARLEEEARRQAEEQARLAREAQARAAAERAANPPPPPPPQPPPIPFKYLGYLGPKDKRYAAFEDGQEIVVAQVGDVLRNQFKIVDIQYDSVVIGYTRPEFAGRTQTLNMTRRK